ncbi:DNRLRE domain-containing protein [Streptosporangium sp. NBC_01756]|uniref:DNRLRE domain-containing protein n=1 Tax=Streptosporangium sp. NBC_01756 TaxID=2975950 RepID=UPI002DDA3BE6|nr:DNRLRE domain-containing protein [Streptosporangium sp. NBC_01756]WSC85637.1 DNRLRE domain-containing protein [Streptosporangium sp. NBC_01756]
MAATMVISLAAAPSWAEKEPEPTPASAPTSPTPATASDPVQNATEEAKKQNKPIEIASLHTENSTTVANPDGKTLGTYVYSQPVRVKRDGTWKAVDTTLVAENGVVKPRATKLEISLSDGGDTTLLTAKGESLGVNKGKAGKVEIAAPNALPAPKLSGNKAVYESVYGRGVDMVVTVTPTGFHREIVIRERPSRQLTLPISADLPSGMSYGKTSSGTAAVLANDKPVTELATVRMLDATAAEAPGSGRIGTAKTAVEQKKDGPALVLSPDAGFLADPQVTYPVTLAADGTDWYGGGYPDDTFINNKTWGTGGPNQSMYKLLVGNGGNAISNGDTNDPSTIWRSYLRFDLTGAPFMGKPILNADLRPWNYRSHACGDAKGDIVVRRITSNWSVNSLSWSNQPTVTTSGQGVKGSAVGDHCSGDLTSRDVYYTIEDIVRDWSNGQPNYGLRVGALQEGGVINWREFRSANYTDFDGHPPHLFVKYEEPPVPLDPETVVISSREPLTSFPEYEEALTRSVHVPETVESIQSLAMSEEDVAANAQYRDGTGSFIGTDKISPSLPYPGDGDDTDNPDGEDTAAPRVGATEPANEATDVPLDSQIRVTFTEAVDGPIISVKNAQGVDVQGTVALDSTGEIATFTPTQPLRPGTRYTVEVSEATDSWENVMLFPYTWSFRTADQAAARWTFDEGNGRTAADSSGQGHGATLNDTASWIPGKNGNAVSNTPTQAQVTASREAARQGKAVEVADQTTATSITYAQPDEKTFTTEISAGPVRTQQEDVWVPIDTTLVEQNGVLKPKAIDSGVDVEVSTGGGGAFVKMTADGRRYALSWPAALTRPTVKGNAVTYTDAAGPGADLVVTVLPTGFRHDVVLRERPADPLELRIGVETGGLTLTEGKGGRLLLTSGKDKKLVASAPQPVMWDTSAGAHLATSRLPQARHAKIATDVVTTGGRTELVLKPDHVFLSDPATQYPVRVDPTTTLPFNHDVDVSSTNTADFPADPTTPIIMAGTRIGSLKYRVHLRFDTTSLTGATVTDAKLSVLNIGAQACGSAVGAGIQVRRLTSAWDENNLYWANKPTSTTEDAQINKAGYDSACADPTPLEWPATGIAQDWATGAANHGLVLQSPTETNVENFRVFPASEEVSEFNSPPTLTVTTTGPASAPAISALTVTPAQDVSGTTTVTSLAPQLAATVADPIGGTLTGQFEIEHDPAATGQGTGQIWASTSAAVASGAQATVAVPAGKLTDGWKVRWRARAANIAASTTSAWSAWQMATIDVPGPISEPAVGALQVTPSTVVNGTTVTSTLTPTLLAQVSDPAGGTLRAEYELEHDPAAPQGQGAGQIWTGGVDNVASGTQAGIAVPTGKLTDGWKVRWRARAVAGQLSSAWSDWQQVTIDAAQPGEEPLAQTAGPVIRTDQSFTATAWLRWNDKDGDYTVVEQKGTHQAPFRLGNTPDRGLVFTFTSADIADATIEGVRSGVEPPVNEWFHLAGVYEASSRTATLYLNGNPIGNAALTFPTWNATRAMTLGSQLSGAIDDVVVYQRPLTTDEVAAVVAAASASHTPSALPTSVEPKRADLSRAASQSGAFAYEHPKLEDCTVSPSETGYAEYDARIQEKPYSSCWSAYLYIQHYVEEEDDDGIKRKKRAFKTGPTWFALAQSVADAAIAVQNDDTLRFRATWVAHSYLGNETGTGVVGGGTTGIKPHDIKVFTRLDEFAIVDKDGRVKVPGNKLRGLFMDMLVDADVKDEGDCDTGDPGGIRDISAWVTNSDENFLIQAEGSPAHNTICSFTPQISLSANGPGNFMHIPLYSQKVFDEQGKLIGVLRKGSEQGENKRWVPNFRCDWRVFGDNNPDIADRKYACVNTRAKQVFVMSKSRDTDWPEVTRHIEAALNTDNKGTFPPLRPGHDWTKPSYPPTRNILGNEQNKAIPGNWGAPGANNPAGAPLTRGPVSVTSIENRLHFQQIDLHMDEGTDEENHWLLENVYKPYYINTCKYYERKKYPKSENPLVLPYNRDMSCDEYPFANSMEGAKRAKGNYSLRVVNTKQNSLHGSAVSKFFTDFRVGEGNKFWVLIED